MSALLVIDVQKRFGWKEPEESEEMDNGRRYVASNIIAEIKSARLMSRPIIFIVYGDRNRLDHADKLQLTGICDACTHPISMQHFLQHLHGDSFEPIFFKAHANAFSNRNLGPYLQKLGVTEVTLVGCETNGCVFATARGALEAGFNVTLLANCAFDRIFGLLRSQIDSNRWMEELEFYNRNGNQVKVKNLSLQ